MRSQCLAIAISIALLTGAAACRDGDSNDPQSQDPSGVTEPADPGDTSAGPSGRPLLEPAPEPGVQYRLSDAEAVGPPAADRPPLADAEPLSPERVAELLGRLPAMPETASEQVSFALRPGPEPPVLTGDEVQAPFPPEGDGGPPPDVAAGALEVLRYQPDGDVALASHLAVTFSEPMVPLTSHAVLADREVPVRLEPEPEGEWRWVGSRTLLFEPDPRFPMATEYIAEVPAGTAAESGNALSESVTWSFRTPPPTVITKHPTGGPTERRPVIFISFDQAIDVEAVLPYIAARADGEDAALRQASAEEIAGDESVARLVARQTHDDRWVALRPETDLPMGAEVVVIVDAGTPSAEGPRVTTEPTDFRFVVYGALTITGVQCAGDEGAWEWSSPSRVKTGCLPLGPLRIRFSNPLDAAAFEPTAVTAEPEIPGMSVVASGNTIAVTGATQGRTRYTVRVAAEVLDVFGNTMADSVDVVFETGDADPMLAAPGSEMIVLDPAGAPTLDVMSINNDGLDVRIYEVEPEDWRDYLLFSQDRDYRDGAREGAPDPPGAEVWSGTVRPEGERDSLAIVPIDLTPALTDGHGHVVVIVEPEGWSPNDSNWGNRRVSRWVQATDLGLDVFSDSQDVLAWVTELADGQPVEGATVSIQPDGDSAATAADGLASLAPLADRPDDDWPSPVRIEAQAGQDVTFMPEGHGYDRWSGGGGWGRSDSGERLTWYVFDDRGIYKPGETAHVKGWVRHDSAGKHGDVSQLETPIDIAYTFTARNGSELATGDATTDEWGGFHLVLEMPDVVELGQASLELVPQVEDRPDGSNNYWHQLRIDEFRRPEFKVTARADAPNYIVDEQGVAVVEANYYAGGALQGAEVRWDVNASPTSYSPPGHDGFVFGNWQPWWRWEPWAVSHDSGYQSHQGVTDATGQHRLAVDVDSVEPLSPVSFGTQATVMDVNRQAWSSSAALLFHPSELYVGVRPDRWFKEAGEQFELELIAADLDGEMVPGATVRVAAERVSWDYHGGEYKESLEPAGACEAVSGTEPVVCELTFDEGGEYRITAEVVDDQGRPNLTRLMLWVPGGQVRPNRDLESDQVMLIPGAESYLPGESAEILVQAPFVPAEGLLTVRRSGIVHHERFRMDEASTRLNVPIEDGWVPNVTVQVDLVGAAERDAGAPGGVGIEPAAETVSREGGEAADEGTDSAAGADGSELEQGDGELPPRPAFASGSVELNVPPTRRELQIEALPADDALEPGEGTTVEITVLDADGSPVADAGVALVVVDEAVLALTGHQVPDPLDVFYWHRSPDVSDTRQRSLVQVADPGRLVDQSGEVYGGGEGAVNSRMAASGSAMGKDEAALMPMDMAEEGEMVAEMAAPAALAGAAPDIALTGVPQYLSLEPTPTYGLPQDLSLTATPPPARERVNLDPLAAFVPDLRTDGSGRVSVDVDLPDSVTRYRITAVGTDGDQRFGKGESQITARLPLIVRPSAPRFLNYGDVFELPVVVQNQTDEPVTAEVVMRTANLALTDADGYSVEVPAEDRVEVRFPAAAGSPGTAAFQVGAFTSVAADAQRVSLPVWTPATTEAFATYGEIDEGAVAQPVLRPPDVVDEFGGLTLTTSSTALSSLTDAFMYLRSYPYEGAEQIASRLIATVALADVLTAFGAEELPSPQEIAATVAQDIERLEAMQNPDGGFGWWRPGEDSHPFPTVHVAHALARSAAKGYEVDADTRRRVLDYLRNIGSQLDRLQYAGQSRWSMEAYALYVRSLLGDGDPAAARELFARASDPTVETLGWLLLVLSDDPDSAEQVAEIRRQLGNRASEEAGTAQFASGYGEVEGNLVLASDRRSDAVVLEALIADQPDHDLIPKLVRGLLGHRQQGRWSSTQENAFVLLALDKYFREYERDEPDFLARAWLGDGYIGEQQFVGRSPDSGRVDVPMSALSPDGDDVVLSKDGAGRLYYRLGMDYAPDDLELDPLERGFSVERTYEAIDDPDDVKRSADGTWRIRPGARVRVNLTMVAPQRRYHVALVDPLPAGLEALNPELAVTGDAPPPEPDDPEDPIAAPMARGWWPYQYRWYDHESFRDERVETFGNLVSPGVHTYSYVARATTPGAFVVPPAKAEEMYHPETFGRSGSTLVVVE